MTAAKNSLLCLTLIASLTSIANAQLVSTKSGTRLQTYGTSSNNVQLYADGEIRREDMRYRPTSTSQVSGPARMRYDAEGKIYVHTHVFGRKFTAFSLIADGHLVEGRGYNSSSWYVPGTPQSSAVRGHIKLRLAGYTFLERTRYGTGRLGCANYSRNVIDMASTFYPGGVPVRVGVRGGATLGFSANTSLVLDPTSSSRMMGNSRIELTGAGSGYCSGYASAGVGWSGFGAGVEFELRFLNSTLELGVSGSSTSLQGVLGLVVQPVTIYLRAYAEAWRRWTMTIASYSPGNAFTWRRYFS